MKSMTRPDNTAGTAEAEEDFLTYTVSDEAIEAAAGIKKDPRASILPPQSEPCLLRCFAEWH